jgi:hypothetical protein
VPEHQYKVDPIGRTIAVNITRRTGRRLAPISNALAIGVLRGAVAMVDHIGDSLAVEVLRGHPDARTGHNGKPR